jgi:hypothetical protein
MIHSGNATTQRREERLLRERLQDMDVKLNRLMREVAPKVPGAQPRPPTPPPSPEAQRITALAKEMGDELYHFPAGAIPSLTFNGDDEIVATGITLEGRFWSVSDIVKLNLINERGAWLWHRYSQIAMALPPVSNDYLRPHYPATVAGRPSL